MKAETDEHGRRNCGFRKGQNFGHDRSVSELDISSTVDCKNHLRIDADTYKELLEIVTVIPIPLIGRNTAVTREL